MWFRGLTSLSVDAKGRVAVPKVHRDTLEVSGVKELAVTASPSGCLNVYSKENWLEMEKKLMSVPNAGSKAVQQLQHLYMGYCEIVQLDGTGRLSLTAPQRKKAGIDRKAMWVGQGEKFEIWDEATWEEKFGKLDSDEIDLSDLPDELKALSF